MSSVALLPLCELPKIAMRDGYVGPNAHIAIPFQDASGNDSGFFFASGQQPDFGGTIAQDQSTTLTGTRKPLPFYKDCCSCFDTVN